MLHPDQQVVVAKAALFLFLAGQPVFQVMPGRKEPAQPPCAHQVIVGLPEDRKVLAKGMGLPVRIMVFTQMAVHEPGIQQFQPFRQQAGKVVVCGQRLHVGHKPCHIVLAVERPVAAQCPVARQKRTYLAALFLPFRGDRGVALPHGCQASLPCIRGELRPNVGIRHGQ